MTKETSSSVGSSASNQKDENEIPATSGRRCRLRNNSSIAKEEFLNDDNSLQESRKKRVRTKTARFEFDSMDNDEQRMIQQAIRNSKKEFKRVEHAELIIPEAPTYYPTVEEFKNPFEYISKIREQAERYGICKIVPPQEWHPPCKIDMKNPAKFPTKLQQINTLQEGQGFDEGPDYDIASFKIMADRFSKDWSEKYYGGGDAPYESLAKDYWDAVETGAKEPLVEYGSDLDTLRYCSGFSKKRPNSSGIEGAEYKPVKSETISENGKTENNGDNSHEIKKELHPEPSDGMFSEAYYERTGWNLNNLAASQGSVLKYLQTPINGVNVPWLYVGMQFSSFCWHNEDNYLYSINYNHMGAPKQWYGIPGSEAKNFEKVSKDFLMELFRESPDQLHHMTTQISPSLLTTHNIPIFQMKHQPGTFLVTFPKAYHAGFSYGFNVGEAVNFATYDWLSSGSEADERYRTFARNSVFSHQRLLFTLLNHKADVAPQYHAKLATEVLKVLEEELVYRPFLFGQGVRDISDRVKLPPNSFEAIDLLAAEYDDMRGCHVCKHICVFSAIACECDKTKVTCIRHFQSLCKCPKERKYLLEWASTKDLKALKIQIKANQADPGAAQRAEREKKGPVVPTPSSPVPPLSVPASTGVGEVVGEGVSVSVSAHVGGESSGSGSDSGSGSGSRGGVVTATAVCCPSDPTPSSSLVTIDNVAVVVSEPVRMSDPAATSDTPQIAALSTAGSSSVISIPTGTVGQGQIQGPGEGDSVNLPQGSCSLLPSAVSVVEIQPPTSTLSLSLSPPSLPLPSSLPLSSPLPPSSQPLPTI